MTANATRYYGSYKVSFEDRNGERFAVVTGPHLYRPGTFQGNIRARDWSARLRRGWKPRTLAAWVLHHYAPPKRADMER